MSGTPLSTTSRSASVPHFSNHPCNRVGLGKPKQCLQQYLQDPIPMIIILCALPSTPKKQVIKKNSHSSTHQALLLQLDIWHPHFRHTSRHLCPRHSPQYNPALCHPTRSTTIH